MAVFFFLSMKSGNMYHQFHITQTHQALAESTGHAAAGAIRRAPRSVRQQRLNAGHTVQSSHTPPAEWLRGAFAFIDFFL